MRGFLMRACLALCLLVPIPTAAAAQGAADADAVLAAIHQLFDGMREADPAKVRAVLAPDARFAVIEARDGPATVQARPVDGWVESIGRSEGRWDEQIYDVDVRVDGAMASAWTPYTFYLDGAVRHCGINSIELLRDAEGWKITQISDTRRTERCPDPLAGR